MHEPSPSTRQGHELRHVAPAHRRRVRGPGLCLDADEPAQGLVQEQDCPRVDVLREPQVAMDSRTAIGGR